MSRIVERLCEEPQTVDSTAYQVALFIRQQAAMRKLILPFLELIDLLPLLSNAAWEKQEYSISGRTHIVSHLAAFIDTYQS